MPDGKPYNGDPGAQGDFWHTMDSGIGNIMWGMGGEGQDPYSPWNGDTPEAYANKKTFNSPYEIARLRQMALLAMQGDPSGSAGNFEQRQGWADSSAALNASQSLGDQTHLQGWRQSGNEALRGTNDYEMRRAALREMLRRQEYNRQAKGIEQGRDSVRGLGRGVGSILKTVVGSQMGGGMGGGGSSQKESSSPQKYEDPYGYNKNPWDKDKE